MKDNCKSCKHTRIWSDTQATRQYKEIRHLQFRAKYLALLIIDLQQEILCLSGLEIKEKPLKCDDCGEKKVLYNMTLNHEIAHDWLCQKCCRKQESNVLNSITNRLSKQADKDYANEFLL